MYQFDTGALCQQAWLAVDFLVDDRSACTSNLVQVTSGVIERAHLVLLRCEYLRDRRESRSAQPAWGRILSPPVVVVRVLVNSRAASAL